MLKVKEAHNNKNSNKMTTIKEQTAKITNNPIGAVVGGIAIFYAAKKFGKIENKWALAGAALVGVVLGAMVQSKMKAKSSAPTAATVAAKK